MTTAVGAVRPERYPAVDALKFLGIIGVVWIHAVRSPWDPGAVALEIWLGRLAHFAVPGFLAASGFLYASTTPASLRATGRRLLRILIPYLVASLAAQLWWAGQGQARGLAQGVEELLLASSFGPYYYVFQIFTLVLLAPLVALLPRWSVWPVTGLLILAQLFVNSLGLPLFWGLRIPLFSGGSFMLGWALRLHYESLLPRVSRHRGRVALLLALPALACAWGMTLGLAEFADRCCEWLYVNLVIGFIFSLSLGRGDAPRLVRMASDATYAVFLVHLFFIYGVLEYRPLAAGSFDIAGMALLWGSGMVGALAVVGLARVGLGRRARLLIGA